MKSRYKNTSNVDINSRFNKQFVEKQLKVFSNLTDDMIKQGVTIIYNEWCKTHVVPEKRPRFWKLKDTGLTIALSEYSTHYQNGIECETIYVGNMYNRWASFGLPKMVIGALGGEHIVCKIVMIGGLELLIEEIKKTDLYNEQTIIIESILNDLNELLDSEIKGMGNV